MAGDGAPGTRTLGILDWGVGGLFALLRARSRAQTADLVYLSDAGSVPYGKQPRRGLARSVSTALRRLAAAGATEALVACHSASTALRDVSSPIRVRGVIDARGVPRDAAHTLVIGGTRTIRSGAWRRVLGVPQLTQRVAQPLSAHVESGRAESAACLADLDAILAPGLRADVVVLACTHYAALAPAICARMPHALIVDPALAVVDDLSLAPGRGSLRVMTTGDPDAMRRAAASVGLHVGPIERVD